MHIGAHKYQKKLLQISVLTPSNDSLNSSSLTREKENELQN